MARRTECYVDTSAFIAFLDRSDSHHSSYRRLFADPPALVASALVVVEGHGWFLRRYDQQRALQFLHFVEELTPLVTVPFDEKELAKARRLVQKYYDQALTLADAHGLVILSEKRITRCWSTDRRLGLTGAELVV